MVGLAVLVSWLDISSLLGWGGGSQRTEDENPFCPSYCCHHHFILLFVAITTLPVITTFLEFLSMQHRRVRQLGADCYCYSCHSYVTVEDFLFQMSAFLCKILSWHRRKNYESFSDYLARRRWREVQNSSVLIFQTKHNNAKVMSFFIGFPRPSLEDEGKNLLVRYKSGHIIYWKKKDSSFHYTSHIHPPNISHPCPCSRWMRMLVYEPWLQLSFMLVFGGYNVEKWNGVVPIYPSILDLLIIIIIIIIIIGFLKLDQEPIIPS